MREWIIDEPKQRVLTEKRYHAGHKPEYIKPIEFVVYHYTAGFFDASMKSLIREGFGPGSAHFLVAEDGLVYQLCPLSERTFHAGGKTSKWRGTGGVNDRSIGIEIVNCGLLTMKTDGAYTWFGRRIEPARVIKGSDGKYWHAYPEPQIAAVAKLTEELIVEFPQLLEPDGSRSGPPSGRFVGHENVDPSRKTDPGAVYPWRRILESVVNR